jgi:hypothetical protein
MRLAHNLLRLFQGEQLEESAADVNTTAIQPYLLPDDILIGSAEKEYLPTLLATAIDAMLQCKIQLNNFAKQNPAFTPIIEALHRDLLGRVHKIPSAA